MVEKECVVCGKLFNAKRSDTKYCSDTCKERRQREIAKEKYKDKKIVVTSTCKHCGKEFTYEKNYNNYGVKEFCSKHCRYSWQSEMTRGKPIGLFSEDVSKTCPECGKDFTCSREYKERVFCSKECKISHDKRVYSGENHHNWKGGNVKKTCELCGREFEVTPTRLNVQRFCSVECRSKSQSINFDRNKCPWYKGSGDLVLVKCSNCNGDVYRPKSVVHLRKHIFCSDLCRSEFFKGRSFEVESSNDNYSGHIQYHHSFASNKNKYRAIDFYDHKCVLCGKSDDDGKSLIVHHIFENQRDLPFEDALYVTLCRGCHNIVHHKNGDIDWESEFMNIITRNGGKCFE